ncbi:MAG TPA: cyclic nucleotide-binding protein [Anaerolineae bacterium]|nr:cyclic nucleotide-binding protein [Anaerolineae bacterium]
MRPTMVTSAASQDIPLDSLQGMIQMRQVIKTFKNAAGEFRVLKGLNLSIKGGEFVAIVGKSGSGKSTLLNMITGIDFPTSGQVIVNGVDIHKMNESQRALWRGRNLGIVFQFFQLLPMLSLLENVMLPMDYVEMYDFDQRPKRAMELLKIVGLEKQANKLPVAVSTGQQQSAAIARALATDPPIIVADEPTGNLDSRSASYIIDLFDQLVHQGKTIAMVTHDPSLTERTSRTIVISDGELIDETLAHALPLLKHHQMLEATRLLEHLSFQPNTNIIHKDTHVDYFYMITSGEVEVVLCGKKKRDVSVARLSAGQFFGEVELLRGGKSIACVRAAPEGPVELVALPRQQFISLLGESPLTADTIAYLVQQRIEENRSADRRSRRWFGKEVDSE